MCFLISCLKNKYKQLLFFYEDKIREKEELYEIKIDVDLLLGQLSISFLLRQ